MTALTLHGEWILVTPQGLLEQIHLKSAPGRMFDRSLKAYLVPCDTTSMEYLVVRFADAVIADEVHDALAAKAMRLERAAGIRDGVNWDRTRKMPVKGSPFDHQFAAFDMAMELFL